MQLELAGNLELKIKNISDMFVEFEAYFVYKNKRFLLENNGIRSLAVDSSLTIHNLKTEITIDDDWIKEQAIEILLTPGEHT